MEIKRSGSTASGKGPADYFSGSVRIDPLIEAPDPARVVAAHVTFEPGARTAWHKHPLGQTLIVTSGLGRAQRWGLQFGQPERCFFLFLLRSRAVLDPRQHRWHHDDGLTFEAIGGRLGISADGARKLWVRALIFLKRDLGPDNDPR